jgi:adenosylmethionine-8-amino-7-oxononanoate aminotransferase
MTTTIFQKGGGTELPVLEWAEGAYVRTKNGRVYFDAVGGAYVNSIGYGVKAVVDLMSEQAALAAFVFSGFFNSDIQKRLTDLIVAHAPKGMAKVYLVAGGSEATEVAIKFARHYQLLRGRKERWRIIGRWHSYHGATVGAMSASGHAGRRKPYLPYMLNFPHIPAPDIYRRPSHIDPIEHGRNLANALEEAIKVEDEHTIAAFIAEPIVGAAGGVMIPPPGYYERIREICDQYDILFIADEVITGFGRTGAWFAIDHWNTVPDLILTGKGISSGYAPLGAVILHQRVSDTLDKADAPLFTGYTYSAHAVSCAAGVGVLEYIVNNDLVSRVRALEPAFREALAPLANMPMVGDIRLKGLLVGIELVADRATKAPFPASERIGPRIARAVAERDILIHANQGGADGVDGDNIMLAPPYCVTEGELKRLGRVLLDSVREIQSGLDGRGSLR